MSLRKRLFAVPLLVALLVVFTGCSGQPTAPYVMASADSLPDFVHNASSRVREAYQFAIANPHDLETVPCFCGCGNMGHMSNLHCYIKDIDREGNITFDNHAAGCGICVDITQDVMRMKAEGRSAREIRTYIDNQYGSFGPSTDTVMPQ